MAGVELRQDLAKQPAAVFDYQHGAAEATDRCYGPSHQADRDTYRSGNNPSPESVVATQSLRSMGFTGTIQIQDQSPAAPYLDLGDG